ncbi:MAG: hypothetical protein E7277_08250 [Lachnospiraceae bacterium]|nr:hypothetical protein [Lachnospiraceae bacterium]
MKKTVVKKSVTMMLAFIMVITLLPGLPAMKIQAADQVITEAQRTILKGVYEKLKTNGAYKEYKEQVAKMATVTETYEENEDGTVVITVKQSPLPEYEQYADGDHTALFYIDKDNNIYCYTSGGNYFPSLILPYVAEAICEYCGMTLTKGEVRDYLFAVDANAENADDFGTKFYNVKLEDKDFGIKTIRLYAGGKWNQTEMKELVERTWFTDQVIKNYGIEALNNNHISGFSTAGNYTAYYTGDKNEFKLYLASKGSYGELGWKSIKNLVTALKPVGYEDFDYAGEKEAAKANWTVKVVTGEEIPDTLSTYKDGYEIVCVTFESPYIFGDTNIKLSAGDFYYVVVSNGYVKKWTSSNKKIAKVSNDGNVTALKKGTVTITATLDDGTKLTCKVTVKNSPTVKVGGKKFVSSKTYTIKRGKNLKVAISGKAASVNNNYASTNAKVAKVTSKKSVDTINIKGLKRGKATVTVMVNGVSFKIKVKVV